MIISKFHAKVGSSHVAVSTAHGGPAKEWCLLGGALQPVAVSCDTWGPTLVGAGVLQWSVLRGLPDAMFDASGRTAGGELSASAHATCSPHAPGSPLAHLA